MPALRSCQVRERGVPAFCRVRPILREIGFSIDLQRVVIGIYGSLKLLVALFSCDARSEIVKREA